MRDVGWTADGWAARRQTTVAHPAHRESVLGGMHSCLIKQTYFLFNPDNSHHEGHEEHEDKNK
jgi:hypothetical protein